MENYSDLHQVCVQVFEVVSKTTTVFILPLFMLRIVFSSVLGEGSKIFSILKGIIVYFCLLAAFPLIIEILFSIPESYLPKYNGLSALTENAPAWSSPSIIPFSVDRILEVLLAGVYWIAYYLHIFFMIVMCSMAPIVFLTSTLLGLGLGLEIFLGLLLIGSSWPIIWYGFDQVHTHLVSAQTDEFGAKCLELLLTLFKGLAPVTFAALAVKSPVGKAVTSAAQAVVTAGKWTAIKAGALPATSIAAKRNNSKVLAFERGRSRNSQASYYGYNNSDRLSKAKNQKQSQSPAQAQKNSPAVKQNRSMATSKPQGASISVTENLSQQSQIKNSGVKHENSRSRDI